MSRWRRAFDRIGGPDAVTWPAFWITYVLSVVGHVAASGASGSIAVRLLMVTIAQVAAFIPLVVLRFTLLRDPARPRPWVAVAGFIVAAVIRTFVLGGLLLAIGALSEPQWLYRFISALNNLAVPLFVIAIVMSTMRAHARSLARLISVQQELVATEQRIVNEVTQRNEEALAKVQDRLRVELEALDSSEGAASVSNLQRLVTDVVRPMSHELAKSMPARDIAVPVSDVRVTWRQAATQIVDRPPLQPLIAAVFMVVILLAAALAVFGVARGVPLALTMFVSIIVLSWAANWVLARVLTRLDPRAVLITACGACVAVGYLSALASSYFLPAGQSRVVFVALGGVFPTLIVALSALVTTILRQQRTSEHDVAEFSEALRVQLVRLRQAQWLQRQALSRALHGPVQAAVTSAALRLDTAVRAGQPAANLIDDARQDLLATIDVLDAPDTTDYSLDVALDRIHGTWEGICDVTLQIDADAAARLHDDAPGAAVAIDIMTEAVSNAVRHGNARHVNISIAISRDSLITLSIRDDGRVHSGSAMPGLGSTLLDECTLEWRRDVTSDGCLLEAVLPTSDIR